MSSMRGAEDSENARPGTQATTGTPDRRSSHHRVHFEALVAVGEAKGQGGFEAESVDVSPDGMRLRTAYLPQLGDKLLCRFEGDAGEVVADGEVIWRREQPRGGEFGLRFVGFDSPEAEATLKSLCAELNGEPEASTAQSAMAIPGTRVRLHIEGLGSPMKARVRDSAGAEVQVGSNLEFLKVGRSLELEDMDHGDKRSATVDSVKVEVDPATRVPQLVVSLRFDDAKEGRDAKKPVGVVKAPPREASKEAAKEKEPAVATLGSLTRPSLDKPTPSKAEPAALSVDAKDRIKTAPMRSTPPVTRPSAAGAEVAIRGMSDDAIDEEVAASDPSLDSPAVGMGAGASSKKDIGAVLRGAGAKAHGATKAAFGAIGPAFGKAGSHAGRAMSGLLAAIRKRRGEEEEQAEGQGPRRTTAAPPGGALRSSGRKLVREKDEAETMDTPKPTRSPRKAALIGSGLGLVVVLLVVGGMKFMASRGQTTDTAAAPEGASSATPVAALPATTGASPADPNATPTVNVPLFGATPLSTTEPVPAMPTQPDGAAAANGAAPGAAPAADDTQAQAAPSADEGDDEDAPQGNGKQFGKGSVHNPITLKVKTDGPIESVNGAAGAMGFTISLPGRRALSSASELARKDKRIASINVVNNPAGAEISVQFKDGVPSYMAKAKGDRLDIALAGEAKKKVAKAGGDKKKKKASDKKKAPAKKTAKKH